MIDVLVIGGGPGGSTAATLLARKGFSVTLLERERFPRFQVGESLLPYNNDLFERLGVTVPMTKGTFTPKYGAGFVTADGALGYTFRFRENLPEAYHSSFQVKRAEFDELLLRNAAANGVDVREETAVTAVDLANPNRATVTTSDGERIEARFVVDASGHGAFLGNRIGGKEDVEELKKVAIFAHYKNVPRPEGRDAGNTMIVVLRDAWFWLIPVSADTMSVGLVVARDHLKSCGLSAEELLDRTIAGAPYLAERVKKEDRITQVYVRRDFSFMVKRRTGKNFALIGDAAGFLDPIFSTGVFMAMKSADIAADAIDLRLRKGSMRLLNRYDRSFESAMNKYFRFIANFYRREFLEVFLQPKTDYGLIPVITGILAGNIFETQDRLKLALFFFFVRLQKMFGVIAPPIAWEELPGPASM
ncbi:MAG TPA: NAD(P)/FAD-dependent oxidoreductase [Thermoanaerobaculia bacterium]|nr:NAD(P)/FAD-dependent oxidoreductase [Thermoanaerobaculia bacterium]